MIQNFLFRTIKYTPIVINRFHGRLLTTCIGETPAKRVLVIYTGGTLGMVKDESDVLVPNKKIETVLRTLPQLHDENYWQKNIADTDLKDYLVLPAGKDTKDFKVLYKIHEYEQVKDSSDFGLEDWIRQARDIKKFYPDYDGFVVLHGTDTTAYGASLLSFMVESVGKTVVLTGAQIPILQPRTDGNSNLLCAILVAATKYIPEISVFFGYRLFRGCRVKKISNNRMYAFDSPNYSPLLESKNTFYVDPNTLIHPPGSVPDECRIFDKISSKVCLLKFTPTVTADFVKTVINGMEGVVIETYGNGNVPIKAEGMVEVISNAVKNGVLIVNVTQCINGNVIANPQYENGMLITKCGVVPTYDMTAEAAWAKLCYLCGRKDLSYQEKCKMVMTNMRGELTVED